MELVKIVQCKDVLCAILVVFVQGVRVATLYQEPLASSSFLPMPMRNFLLFLSIKVGTCCLILFGSTKDSFLTQVKILL